MARISYLGMGAMGSRMARHLVDAGHQVTVWNRHSSKTEPLVEAGARVAATPAEAAESAEFVFACLRDNDASREAWLGSNSGALAAMPDGAVAIESSTLTPEWSRELAENARSAGIAFLDAPVLGSLPQAEASELIFLVGGDEKVLERVRPILMEMGSDVHHAGPTGNGAAVKLIVNGLLGIQVAAMGELIGLMTNLDLDPEKTFEIVSSTPVCSTLAKRYGESMLRQEFDPLFSVKLAEKDFSYIVQAAGGDGSSVPLARRTREIFAEAIKRGFGELNMSGVVKLYDPE